MSLWAVIWRELLTQARQPFTYTLRILGALAVGLAFTLVLSEMQSTAALAGRSTAVSVAGIALFGKTNLFIFAAVWILGPLITADCLSRERREGTLSLLYLTNLSAGGIVLGKASVQFLRALMLFVTMAPWLLLPMLFGGIGLKDVGLALALDLTALLLALSAGLVASAFPRDWLKAVILAEAIAFLLFLCLLDGYGRVVANASALGFTPPTANLSTAQAPFRAGRVLSDSLAFLNTDRRALSMGFATSAQPYTARYSPVDHYLDLLAMSTNHRMLPSWITASGAASSGRWEFETNWSVTWATLNARGLQALFTGVAGLAAAAVTILLVAVWLATALVRRSWRDTPPSAEARRFRKVFLSPRFALGHLRNTLSAALDRNPVGWLQEYSPAGRLVKWGWCLFIVVAEVLAGSEFHDLFRVQRTLGTILLLGLAFSSTASFRTEMESGAFELLLVTPLRERKIVWGRLIGLWKQFLPAMLIYALGNIILVHGWQAGRIAENSYSALGWDAARFLVIPFFGLASSFCRINFLFAWVLTCVAAWGPSWISLPHPLQSSDTVWLQAFLAAMVGLWIELNLTKRWFLKGTA